MIIHHPFVVLGAVTTLENKMATPCCSLVTISPIYNSFLTLSGQQSDPSKGPVPTQRQRHFHSLCEMCSLSSESNLSLCSRFPTRSRKPLPPSIWSAHSVLLNAHPNLKSLSAASVQEEMYNYLRRMPRDFWLFYLLDIQVWLLYRGFWVLQMCSNTERQLWSSQSTYFRDL